MAGFYNVAYGIDVRFPTPRFCIANLREHDFAFPPLTPCRVKSGAGSPAGLGKWRSSVFIYLTIKKVAGCSTDYCFGEVIANVACCRDLNVSSAGQK